MSAPGSVASQMMLDGHLATGVTQFVDLAVELCGVSAAFVPALVQGADVRIGDASPLGARGDDIVGSG